VCSGTATILQAGVARRLPTADRLDAGLLLRLLRRAPYLTALALLVAGLLLAIFSLRTLPSTSSSRSAPPAWASQRSCPCWSSSSG
jgi:hypothetical protein